MEHQSRLFPAWVHLPQEYHIALEQRLPRAIAAGLLEGYSMVNPEMDQEKLSRLLHYPGHHWRRFVRRSKCGKETHVWSPTKHLRNVQEVTFLAFFPPADNCAVATAFGPGCSIIKNAKPHRNGQSSFRIDIQNAFPSITANHISTYLVRKGVDKDMAWVLARLWTYRGRLEQGAPVAPTIFNAMLERLDEDLLHAIGDEFVYTRYGDDMCFSCTLDEFPAELEVVIRSIVETHGFRINVKKTRRGKNGIVDLPGIAIKNGRIRPNGAYRKKIQDTWRLLLPKQIAGHRAYMSSFGHSGNLRVLRSLIGNRTKC